MGVVDKLLKRHWEERSEKPVGGNENEEAEAFIRGKP